MAILGANITSRGLQLESETENRAFSAQGLLCSLSCSSVIDLYNRPEARWRRIGYDLRPKQNPVAAVHDGLCVHPDRWEQTPTSTTEVAWWERGQVTHPRNRVPVGPAVLLICPTLQEKMPPIERHLSGCRASDTPGRHTVWVQESARGRWIIALKTRWPGQR